MTGSEIDYGALFASLPSPHMVLDPGLLIRDVNRAYLRVTGRTRGDLVGRYFFEAFTPNPERPAHEGFENLRGSLLRVLRSRRVDTIPMQRYDIPDPSRPGHFMERWWSPINTPVLAPDGSVRWIIHRVEDVTGFVSARVPAHVTAERPAGDQRTEAELYAWAQELEQLNEELRRAHDRESQVALTLQESLLHSPDLPRPGVAVAVGDVVGHGLEAAGVMGMLRSALSAAMRATDRPGRALQILGLYANSVEGAESATAIQVRVDTDEHVIAYSSAGHLPPVLLHPEGDCQLLDRATDPPLATREENASRPQARVPYRPGDCLVLYTDGLVERPGEDIDAGLSRLTSALTASCGHGAEQVADEVLARLGVSEGARDDIALVVVSL